MSRSLHKTLIVIWTEFDPSALSFEALGREADQGEGYCSYSEHDFVKDPIMDPHYCDGMLEFFQLEESSDG